MALISEGINKVRAFELPCGIRADGSSAASGRTALVRWRSSWSDKFYQVYVNGEYAGVTVDSEQRQLVVGLPAYEQSPVRIKVFAVGASEADTDFGDEPGWSAVNSGRVRISFLRSQQLPVTARAEIYFDNGSGQIDYENRLNDFPIRIWPSWRDKTGFGMSSFGVGDFGLDWAAGVGFGKGVFGRGQFGVDVDVIEWVSEPLPAGVYKFAVKIIDGQGNESSVSETEPITVIPAARPAEHLGILSFDKQINELVLSIS